jgi:hypothetical protein
MQFHTTGIVLAALTAVSAASAQTTQAVEWKVSEGGNGHWYLFHPAIFANWNSARQFAQTLNGHLATLTSSTEQQFAADYAIGIGGSDCWLGGYQDRNARDYSEPAGGWRWVTGEPWSYTAWRPDGQPTNVRGANDFLVATTAPWDHLMWVDSLVNNEPGNARALIEWDTDCNADGIVDYGQILRGELIDLNANGVPDICETSVSSVIPPSVPSQGGSTITIRGNGFQPNPTVRIGGVPATNIVRISLTEITATSPALLPGMASVQVNDFTLQDGIYIRPDCGSDLDQNGAVDGGDMAILLLDWGPCYTTPSTLAAPAPTPLLVPDESTPASTPPAPQSARPTPQPRGTAS